MIIKLFLFDYSISSYIQPNPKYSEGPFNGEPAATNPPPEEEGSFGDVGRIMQVSRVMGELLLGCCTKFSCTLIK